MKAISLWEPWATAMAVGLKKNETRSWPTDYRGDLLICAAKRELTDAERRIYISYVKHAAKIESTCLPFGCALCIVEVFDYQPAVHIEAYQHVSEQERALGNYEAGRWVWLTRNLRLLETPVPVTGRQGFFTVPDELIIPLVTGRKDAA